MRYAVTVRRTELILFEIEADNPADAEARALYEGEEVSSRTVSTETDEITEVPRDN